MCLRWGCIVCVGMLGMSSPSTAVSEWLETSKLSSQEVRRLCGQCRDVTVLARSQMVAAGDAEWRHLSRVHLAVERFAMGDAPLDAAKCYVFARAGDPSDSGPVQRRAFEVRDFASNPAGVRVMVLGWDFQLAGQGAD